MTDKTISICHWLKRSYETKQVWEKVSVDIYISAQGIPVLARTELAGQLRSHFKNEDLATETLKLWNKSHTTIVNVEVIPPKINDSNAAYIDWLYVADYLLICCGTPRAEFDDINTTRRAQYRSVLQSYFLRKFVIDAIDILRSDPARLDIEIVKQLKIQAGENEIQPSLVTVKEAKRWLRAGVTPTEPKKPEPPIIVIFFDIT